MTFDSLACLSAAAVENLQKRLEVVLIVVAVAAAAESRAATPIGADAIHSRGADSHCSFFSPP